ncbi:hypothetical protein HDE_05827 [Halotydeus destructor]|nr:hypothetical protein HDE_05827 [Halotydeus destructor]
MKPIVEPDGSLEHSGSPLRNNKVTSNQQIVSADLNEAHLSPIKRMSSPNSANHVLLSEEGLVLPKKLVNPCLESREKLDLHRELMFNQKIGKSVLGQKTELQKVMEKRLDNQKRKELEEKDKILVGRRNSFERKLEEQASKLRAIEMDEENRRSNSSSKGSSRPSSTTPEPELEFFKIHAKLHASYGAEH